MKLNRFSPALLISALLLKMPSALAAGDYGTSLLLEGRLAQHTYGARDAASKRFTIDTGFKHTVDRRWSYAAGFQTWYETVYADPKYIPQLNREDGKEFRLNDTYVQYKHDEWSARLGWQQIVWGETFGSFYADLINPKDLRESVPGNASKIRISIPALNVKYIKRRFSVQGVLLPQPHFNILPIPGSDYFPPSAVLRSRFKNIYINRERKKDWSLNTMEIGGRVSQVIGMFDLSVFHLAHADRTPYYLIAAGTNAPETLVLQEAHSRVTSSGASVAADIAGYIVRGETVYTRNHIVPTLTNGDVVYVVSDEMAFAASLDLPTWRRLNLSFQIQSSQYSQAADYFLRSQEQLYMSMRQMWSLFDNSTFEFITAYSAKDGSLRTQAEYMYPFADVAEFRIGVENYAGTKESEFGKLWRANRAYVNFGAQFRGL